jgi:hypothetical protein
VTAVLLLIGEHWFGFVFILPAWESVGNQEEQDTAGRE